MSGLFIFVGFDPTLFLACTQALFYFSFRSFTKHRRAKRARSTRKKNKSTPTPLRWRSINPPWYIWVCEQATLFLFLSVSC